LTTLTGAYVAEQRRAKCLTLGQLAAAIGYVNVAKGARRLLALERDGEPMAGLLDKIIPALDLDGRYVQELVAEDRRRFEDEWERWVTEAVEPQLRCRLIPAIWGGERLPTGLSRDAAVAFARSRAMERHLVYVLVWSRREAIWCYEDGRTGVCMMNVGEAAGPFTRLRGRGDRGFTFG
jgi:hypothetical protein